MMVSFLRRKKKSKKKSVILSFGFKISSCALCHLNISTDDSVQVLLALFGYLLYFLMGLGWCGGGGGEGERGEG